MAEADSFESAESAPVPESAPQSKRSKRRLIQWGLAVVVLVVGWFAWHQYTAHLEAAKTVQLSQSVEQSMQKKFDSDPSFSKYHIQVEKVGLIKQSGHKYDGIATVRTPRSSHHDVAIEVTYDGSKITWQAKPGALLFWPRRICNVDPAGALKRTNYSQRGKAKLCRTTRRAHGNPRQSAARTPPHIRHRSSSCARQA
jgi:hypothetical protein